VVERLANPHKHAQPKQNWFGFFPALDLTQENRAELAGGTVKFFRKNKKIDTRTLQPRLESPRRICICRPTVCLHCGASVFGCWCWFRVKRKKKKKTCALLDGWVVWYVCTLTAFIANDPKIAIIVTLIDIFIISNSKHYFFLFVCSSEKKE
jgi:hypothetical protein